MEFRIAANPGEPARSISRVASGGELSRIMLAMKSVLADIDDIDTLIYDEVDAGISGRAARKVGLKLHQTACSRQILCVTHLAQIASQADHHLLIAKQVRAGPHLYRGDAPGRRRAGIGAGPHHRRRGDRGRPHRRAGNAGGPKRRNSLNSP